MKAQTSFWDRRKAAVQAEAEAETRAVEQAEAEQRAEVLAEKEDAVVLEEMGLPDPSTMQKGDDFSGFMARDVPEHLRRQALRTLWRSNPVLACVDGLNEYDDDYRAAMLLSEPIKTAYQVGKGMTKHIDEMKRQAEAQEECEAVEQEAETVEAAPEHEAPLPQSADAEVSAPATPEPSIEQPVEEAAPAPRRMRFQFEEASV